MATTKMNLLKELQGIVTKIPTSSANGQYQEREAMLYTVRELKRRHPNDDVREWREHQLRWNFEMFSIEWQGGRFVVKPF